LTLAQAPDIASFLDWCAEHAVTTLVVGSADTHGSWAGKRVAVRDLPELLAGPGLAFSDVLFTLTRDGTGVVEPEPGTQTYFPRKDNGYPDVFLRPDLGTARRLAWHEQTAALNGTFTHPDGSPLPIAPRNVLARQAARLADAGLDVKIACEFEFYLLHGTAAELAGRDYRLTPISPRPYTYLVSRASLDAPLLGQLRDGLEAAGITVEALNPETGPGQYEINTRYAGAMRAADDAFLFKNGIKEIAAAQGLLATFMAKPSTDWAGSSCHLHQSLWRADDGAPLTWAADAPLAGPARHYLAGQLATMADFAVLFAPTVNSYKRLQPYSWAATTATWGLDNRSVGLRVVGETPGSRRIEHRLGGADVNPYLAIAACLAGGLHGLEHRLEPPGPYPGDAYADPALPRLPGSFDEALERFASSEVAREAYGNDFVCHYTAMKRREAAEHARHVSDWEVRQYVETA
jgi:glutamine synthetase